MARKGRVVNPGIITARWACSSLYLLVGVMPRGVRSITIDRDFIPGQTYLWTDVEPTYTDLRTVAPFGVQLANELTHALSGQLVESKVPWLSAGPPWHLELYRYVCRLPPGRITILPESLRLDGEYRQEREMIMVLQRCSLVPLVPLHRVAATEPIAFPWGEGWGSTLLQRELQHAASRN